MRGPLGRVGRRWSAFWFAPQSLAVVTAIRVGLGVTVLAWTLALLPDLDTFYLHDRLLPETQYSDSRLGLFRFWHGDLPMGLLYVALVAAALGLILAVAVRASAVVAWVGVVSFIAEAPSITNAGDQLLRIWTLLFAVYALGTSPSLLTVPLRGLPSEEGGPRWPQGPVWLIRMMQIQLTVVYVATIIEKLPGDTWREGTAAYYAFGLTDFQRFPIPDLLRESLVVSNLASWTTVGLELSLPFLLWTARTRRFAIVAGLSLHLGFDYAMRLGFFLWAITLGYLAFVRPDEWVRLQAAVGRSAARLWRGVHRSEPPVQPTVHPIGEGP